MLTWNCYTLYSLLYGIDPIQFCFFRKYVQTKESKTPTGPCEDRRSRTDWLIHPVGYSSIERRIPKRSGDLMGFSVCWRGPLWNTPPPPPPNQAASGKGWDVQEYLLFTAQGLSERVKVSIQWPSSLPRRFGNAKGKLAWVRCISNSWAGKDKYNRPELQLGWRMTQLLAF